MILVRCSNAQIDDVHSVCETPFESLHQRIDIGGESTTEDPNSIDLRRRSLFMNDGRNSRSVTEAVDEIRTLNSLVEEDTALDLPNVRVIRIDTTIDDGDANFHRAVEKASSLSLPPSSVITWSAMEAREDRCVMTMAVRPRNAVRSESMISRSVSGSSAAVGSSNTSTGGFLNRARASVIRWRSPAESVTPRSPTKVSYCCGSARMRS